MIVNKKAKICEIMSWEMELDDNILEDLYLWLDSLPLSRPKKKIERDFADGKYNSNLNSHIAFFQMLF